MQGLWPTGQVRQRRQQGTGRPVRAVEPVDCRGDGHDGGRTGKRTGRNAALAGLVKVLGQELDRLGPAAMTAAERFEQSATRIEEARQRIQMAIAGPLPALRRAAGTVEGASTLAGMADL